ncbi:MAG: aconitase X swivel domain-containing protein [Eubacteriaceae bacterium]
MGRIIKGRGVISGVAQGMAMVSKETIQGWSGIDEHTGIIMEIGHPFEGKSIIGSILIISGGKGSNGWSCHFHAAKLAGKAPAGLVFPKIDSRTGVAAVVTAVPTITDLDEDIFEIIKTGDIVRIDGDAGTIEIIERGK